MTLDEAIKHCREVADDTCGECANDHLQLSNWLEELKKIKELKHNQESDVVSR